MRKNEASKPNAEPVGPPDDQSRCPDGPAALTGDRQEWGDYQLEWDDRTPEEAGYGYGV